LAYVAAVTGDDAVMMHAVGDPTDTTVDLFDAAGLPLPRVLFDIGGYDVNSATTNGTSSDCASVCPPPSSGCFVAVGNGTIGAQAGGDEVAPHNFQQTGWSLSFASYTPDALAVGDVHPAPGDELVVLSEGSTWYGS